MQKFIDIMIPAYGESPYLRESIISVLESGVPDDCNIFIVDDGSSTDAVKNIASEFGEKVLYLRNKSNLGVAGNFKHCIEISTAQLTLIMGSDDRLRNGAIEALRTAYMGDPSAALYQLQVGVIDELGYEYLPLGDRVKKLITPKTGRRLNGTKLLRRLFVGDWMYFPAIAWNSAHSKQFNWNTDYETAVDLELILNLANLGESFRIVNFIGFEYRRHSASVSSKLITSGIRIDEELAAQANGFMNLSLSNKLKIGWIAVFAPTIRMHGIKAALELSTSNPKAAIKLLLKSLSIAHFVKR